MWFRRRFPRLEIRVVRLNEGDVIAVAVDHPVSPLEAAAIRAHLCRVFPNHESIILSDGMKLEVLSDA